jgi:sensor histidine kinase YesM
VRHVRDDIQFMYQRLLTYLQLDRTFLLLIFLFSYFLVISNRVRSGMLSWYTFTPEGPVVQFCSALLIFLLLRFWLNRYKTREEKQLNWLQYMHIFSITLLCYLAFNNGLGLIIAALFGNIARNFNADTLLHANLSDIFNAMIYAVIYLAYSHSKQAEQYRMQLADFEQQLSQLKIQQLKAQLNPHFVFNSLNTLDELINIEPKQASDYLHDFSALYRLSIHNAQQQLVSLAQELAFARHYFQLMQTRLGAGYQLHIAAIDNTAQFFLPPFTLQLLLENAFIHNHGSVAKPLTVQIQLQQNGLTVSNPQQPKTNTAASNGIGLTNLSKQFLFLTGKNISITNNLQDFSVCLPLLKEQKLCLTF